MNRFKQLFQTDKKLLSIYFTAGYPLIDDTIKIIKSLNDQPVDFIEIGLPFSDPIADGPTIETSSKTALNNGMNTKLVFNQLKNVRSITSIPILIMGYFNPILQFGVEAFCKKCHQIGIDGLIIPDLPLEVYKTKYKHLFERYQLKNIFLITPTTSEKRIKEIDQISQDSFIYLVSSYGITGQKFKANTEQNTYLKKMYDLNLKSKQIVGFGIHNNTSFNQATTFQDGAIIGSAFINYISINGIEQIDQFIESILTPQIN